MSKHKPEYIKPLYATATVIPGTGNTKTTVITEEERANYAAYRQSVIKAQKRNELVRKLWIACGLLWALVWFTHRRAMLFNRRHHYFRKLV